MLSLIPKKGAAFAFPYQCIWLKLNGSWPIETTPLSLAIYTLWSIFVIFLVGITIYFQATYLVQNFNDIVKMTENCSTTFMGFHNFVRLIHLRLNQKRFRNLINDFKKHIWINEGTDEEIEAACKRELIIFRAISIMQFALICMYCILPLFELFSDLNAAEKPFPYKMIFPYNANSGMSYVLTYIATSYAGFAVVTTLFSEDSLFGFFVTYACGQFKILHKNIGNIFPEGYKNTKQKYGHNEHTEQVIQNEYHIILKRIARKHEIIIRFCKNLDAFYSPILLVNFTISSILICVVGFQIVTGKMSIGNYAKFILYILSALTQLFILCWNGNNLILNSTETAWKLYACNWEGGQLNLEFDEFGNMERLDEISSIQYCPGGASFNRHIRFMIMRSQKPVIVTALKFSVLSLQSFTAILSTSMSYFTLLQTLLESE